MNPNETIREGEEDRIHNREGAESMAYAEKLYREAARTCFEQAEKFKAQGRQKFAEDMEVEARGYLTQGELNADGVWKGWELELERRERGLKEILHLTVEALGEVSQTRKAKEIEITPSLYPVTMRGYEQSAYKELEDFLGVETSYFSIEGRRNPKDPLIPPPYGNIKEKTFISPTRLEGALFERLAENDGGFLWTTKRTYLRVPPPSEYKDAMMNIEKTNRAFLEESRKSMDALLAERRAKNTS